MASLPHEGGLRAVVRVNSKKVEYGPGTICAILLLLQALGLENGHIPTFWLLLQGIRTVSSAWCLLPLPRVTAPADALALVLASYSTLKPEGLQERITALVGNPGASSSPK